MLDIALTKPYTVFMKNNPNTKVSKLRGFTLIELAVVLVIIGLLIVGVLQGRALIEQAEIQKHISAYKDINLAYDTFLVKYGARPGDIAAPEKVGLQYAGMQWNSTLSKGNGDGKVAGNEKQNVWNQLHNSGLYTAQGATNAVNFATDFEGYAKWPAGNNFLVTISNYETEAFNTIRIKGNLLETMSVINNFPSGGLRPEAMYYIDSKLDDGKPGSGMVRAATPEVWNGGPPEAETCYDNAYGDAVDPTDHMPYYPTVDSRYLAGDSTAACSPAFSLK